MVQRLLWARTGTKTPECSDIRYIEALIGLDTVNTDPLGTFDAYRDHGEPQARLEQQAGEAARLMKQLPELGIDIDRVAQELEDESVAKFSHPFDKLMERLADLDNA